MIEALSLAGALLAPVSHPAPAAPSSALSGASFSDALAGVASSAADGLRTAEATSILGLQGKASVQEVVESVMNAQQSLQTAIAIRDKAVAAYQSLTQMAI